MNKLKHVHEFMWSFKTEKGIYIYIYCKYIILNITTTEAAIKNKNQQILSCMTIGSMRTKCRGNLATSGFSPSRFKATQQSMSQTTISLCRELVVRIVGMQLMLALLQPTAKIHLCSSADAPGRRQRTLLSMTSFTVTPLYPFATTVVKVRVRLKFEGSLNHPRMQNQPNGR